MRKSEDREQPEGLAVPQVGVGQVALGHPPADQGVELVVEIGDRIAVPQRAGGEHHEREHGRGEPVAASSRDPARRLARQRRHPKPPFVKRFRPSCGEDG